MIDQRTALKQLKLIESKVKPMRLAAEGWKNDFQVLVAIMLSARTLDETVIKTCEKLFKEYDSVEKFSRVPMSDVGRLISSVNFFRNKAKYLYFMSKKIIEEFEGDVPQTVEELITLAGVGRKTANVFLGSKGGSHIGVDTHVNYISNYLGWVNSDKPEVIEKELEGLFPRRIWNKIGHTLIRFGKTYTSRKEKDMWLDWVLEKTKAI